MPPAAVLGPQKTDAMDRLMLQKPLTMVLALGVGRKPAALRLASVGSRDRETWRETGGVSCVVEAGCV